MFCTKCGSEVRENAKFCSSCGAAAAKPKPIVPEPVVPEPIAPEPIVPEPIAPEPIAPEPIAPEPIAPEPIVPVPIAPAPIAPAPVAPAPIVQSTATATMVAERPPAVTPAAESKPFHPVVQSDEKPDTSKQKPKSGSGRITAAIVLCLLLSVFASLTGFSYIVRTAFSEKSVTDAFSELDLDLILAELNLSDSVTEHVRPTLVQDMPYRAETLINAVTICNAVNHHNALVQSESDLITDIPLSLANGTDIRVWDMSVYYSSIPYNSEPIALDSIAYGFWDVDISIALTGDAWADAFAVIATDGSLWNLDQSVRHNISVETIAQFLAGDAFKAFAEKAVIGYTNALLEGNEDYALSVDDILDFLKSNEAVILEVLEYQMTEQDYTYIETFLKDEGWEENKSLNAILAETRINALCLGLLLSEIAFYVLAGLALLTLIGIIITNRRHGKTILISTGLAFSLTGLLFLADWLMFYKLVSILLGDSVISGVAEHFLSASRMFSLWVGAGALAVGIIFIAIFGLAVSAAKKRAAKALQPEI